MALEASSVHQAVFLTGSRLKIYSLNIKLFPCSAVCTVHRPPEASRSRALAKTCSRVKCIYYSCLFDSVPKNVVFRPFDPCTVLYATFRFHFHFFSLATHKSSLSSLSGAAPSFCSSPHTFPAYLPAGRPIGKLAFTATLAEVIFQTFCLSRVSDSLKKYDN